MEKIIRNVASVSRDPKMLVEYLRWLVTSALTGGRPYRRLLSGIEIGSFSNFSEYHSVAAAITMAEQRFFEGNLATSGSIIDVGANVGLVSLLLARLSPSQTVHSFEPNPSTFAALESNIARNKVKNIVAHQLALANKTGTLLFNSDPISRATARISADGSVYEELVRATTLDIFLASAGIEDIALLKIDVEGFEALVLQGASIMLQRRMARVIYMEVCPELTSSAGFDAVLPAQIVQDAGYRWFRIDGRGELVSIDADRVASVTLENWVALHA